MDKNLEDILEFEKYNSRKTLRPLSVYHNMIKYFKEIGYDDPKKLRKGLAICHGHNYSLEMFKKIKFINYWYMTDISIEAWPDYICDASNEKDMEYFPDNYFDCVLTVYCSYLDENSNIQFPNILKNIHRIIKKNGVILLTELPGLFYWLIDDLTFNEISDRIVEIIGKEALEIFKKHLDELYQSFKYNIYHEILVRNYNGPNREELYEYVDKISVEQTKKILLKNNFEYMKIKGEYLIAKPINK